MPGIGVVLNRNAGKKKTFRGRIGQKLAFVLGDPESVKQTNVVEDITDVAKTFLDRKIDILGISGGDGSNHTTLTTFIKVYQDKPLPKVAFLCGGTHNAHAASLGIKGSPEKILNRIMRTYHTRNQPETIRRSIMKIDDGTDTRYGFTLASGFMYRFYRELVLNQGDSPAKAASLLASWIGSYIIQGKKVRRMFRLEPCSVSVSQEALDWDDNNGISCSSMEMLGLGFTPYPRAGETPRTFQVNISRINPGTFIRLMWNFKRGTVPEHPDCYSSISDHVVAEGKQPIPYVLDGELYSGTNRLEVSSGPQIDFIV
jgi:diacylglycerol kinase family enzyme